jgi:outer membrane protein TolC
MKYKILIVFCLSIFILIAAGHAQGTKTTYRIGYFEGGPFFSHKAIMGEIREYLDYLNNDTLEIIFEPYAYKSAEWRRSLCRAMAGDLARLREIDMVIAAGPWVVDDLLEAGYEKPIVAIYQFAPEITGLLIGNGIPKTSNLTVNYSPSKLFRDISTINKLFTEPKIGFLYFPNGDESKIMVQKVREIAEQFKMKIFHGEGFNDQGTYSFFSSLNKIKRNVDVLYLPPLWGMNLDQFERFFNNTHLTGLPTFVSEGYLLVEKGAVASSCNRPYKQLARFTADKIEKIIAGAVPASLPTIFEEIETVCLNLEEARKSRQNFTRTQIINAKIIPAVIKNPDGRYDITQALDQATVENPNLLSIDQTYQNALSEIGMARSEYFPALNFKAGIATSDNKARAAQYNRFLDREYYADVSLEQKVFSYPTIKSIHIAKKRAEIEKITYTRAKDDLLQLVTMAYLSVLQNKEIVAKLDELVDRYRSYKEIAITNSRLGIFDSLSISLFEEYFRNIRIEYLKAANELKISKAIFNTLLNRPADHEIILDEKGLDASVIAQLIFRLENFISDSHRQQKFENYLINLGMNNSHELIKADIKMGITRDLISLNKNRYLPEISLRAKYSRASEFSPGVSEKDDTWSIGGLLSIPLFQGGSNLHNRRWLEKDLDREAYNKDAFRLNLMSNILSRSSDLFTQMAVLPKQFNSSYLSARNLKTLANKFDHKEITYIEFLSTIEYHTKKELDLIVGRFEFFRSYVDFLHVIGMPYMAYGSQEDLDFYNDIKTALDN